MENPSRGFRRLQKHSVVTKQWRLQIYRRDRSKTYWHGPNIRT